MLLRRRFGVSASEYLWELPAWEVDLLLASVDEHPTPTGDAMGSPPPELREHLG